MMKTILLLTLILICAKSNAQSTMSNLNRITGELQYCWDSGFCIDEINNIKDKSVYEYEISSGSYYTLWKNKIDKKHFTEILNVNGVLYKEITLMIWIESGEIKSSFNGIVTENKVLPLYSIRFTILHGEIYSVDKRDLRGFSLEKLAIMNNKN